MITVPQLDPVSQIQATDVIMITHADGTTEKITGENFMKAMAVDVIAENNMNSVTSNAVAKALPTVQEGVLTIPSQVLQNTEIAMTTLPVTPNHWYNGKLIFENIPIANITVSYNDYSGDFYQNFATSGNYDRVVLFPIGRVKTDSLRMFVANYTGNTITLPTITVRYQLEHHKII